MVETAARGPNVEWYGDILGSDFRTARLDLPDDATAALVHYVPTGGAEETTDGADATADGTENPATASPASSALLSDTVVLHIHGWSDYFFHRDLARFWTGQGADFFAVDLRNCGRNLIPEAAWPEPGHAWETNAQVAAYAAEEWSEYAGLELARNSSDPQRRPGYVPDIGLYNQEIAAALRVVGALHPGKRLLVSAHSMGGLVSVLWAADGCPGLAESGLGVLSALALNAPWLEFQYSAAARKIAAPYLKLRAGGEPGSAKPLNLEMPNFYTLAAAANHGKPQYDLALKPPKSFPVYPDWLHSIFSGHERIHNGVDVGVPVLVQTSDHTYQAPKFSQKMTTADIVLNVDLIRRAALGIGRTVVLEQVPGATHDVFTSAPAAAAMAYAGLERFVHGYAGPNSAQHTS